jgi:hypothetical protein
MATPIITHPVKHLAAGLYPAFKVVPIGVDRFGFPPWEQDGKALLGGWGCCCPPAIHLCLWSGTVFQDGERGLTSPGAVGPLKG